MQGHCLQYGHPLHCTCFTDISLTTVPFGQRRNASGAQVKDRIMMHRLDTLVPQMNCIAVESADMQ
jgi:hypothetical protein